MLLYFIADGSTVALVVLAIFLFMVSELSGTAMRLQAEKLKQHEEHILALANASMGAHGVLGALVTDKLKEKPNGTPATSH